MADQADGRVKALKQASMKEALGKLTGSDELEAQGAREKSGGGVGAPAPAVGAAAPARKKAARSAKSRPSR